MLAPNTVLDYADFVPFGGMMEKTPQDEMFYTPTGSLSPRTRPSSPGTTTCTSSSSTASSLLGSPFRSTSSNASSGLTTLAARSSSRARQRQKKFVALLRSLLNSMSAFSIMGPCRWLTIPSQREGLILGSRVTGTIFGHRRGHVHFSVQEDQRSQPTLILELATPTSTLVRDMASGLVRIALECDKMPHGGKLYQEPIWSMFCNGRKTGYAIRRVFTEFDRHILTVVQAVSMGAGVLPLDEESADGELMYMRARFERVIGSRDSEAFYMMNPDRTGGPELSIFLLRI